MQQKLAFGFNRSEIVHKKKHNNVLITKTTCLLSKI